MPPRTAKFAAHESLDVWQVIWLTPRSSLFRVTSQVRPRTIEPPLSPVVPATEELEAVAMG